MLEDWCQSTRIFKDLQMICMIGVLAMAMVAIGLAKSGAARR